MIPRSLLASIKKARLFLFLGVSTTTKMTKEQLVDHILQLISEDASVEERLLEMFSAELAVVPTELDTLLHCSREERRRWIREGKIPVLEYRAFRKGGRDMLYPVHDRRIINGLSQDLIIRWRVEHNALSRANRQRGARLAAQSRRANQQMRQGFFADWERIVAEWRERGSAALAAVLQLAYWTVWVSRWAKENHVKALKGTKYSTVYAARRDEWYEHKNAALRVLAQTPYARIAFYSPEEPHKRSLWLCETHYEMYKEEGDFYDSIWDFFARYTAMIQQCPDCTLKVEEHYYSLYSIEIASEAFPDVHFSFHMPYPIGKRWFPAPSALPRVMHLEQDGLFRFGRPLATSEKITHRERDVLEHFTRSLAAVKAFYYGGEIGK
jgi:hypothetical protein